ncbi:MAG: serine hydrolase [Eubacteriales bacterium]
MKRSFFMHISISILSLALIVALTSCIHLESIKPVTSQPDTTSQDTSSKQNETTIPSESSQTAVSQDESSAAEQSVESSEEPTPQLKTYDLNGFRITGFEPSQVSALVSTLKGIIDSAGVNVGFYYEELDTGYSIAYNKDKKFCSGSVIKAPYAMHLIAVGADLDEKLTLMSYQKMDGSGNLKNNAAGSSYTVEKLIEYAIIDSDNTAYRMLYDNYGFDYFNMYAYEFGIETGCSSTEYLGYLGFLSAYESGILFKDIYNKSKTNQSAARLLGYLSNTKYHYLLEAGVTNHTVAHKYGYMTGAYKVLHDVGIVLDSKPYIISIMTDFNPSGGNGRPTLKNIASAVNNFHDNFGN